jgi:hypothetical protein
VPSLPPFFGGSSEQRWWRMDMGSGAADPVSGSGGCGILASYDDARAMGSAGSSMGSMGLPMGSLAFLFF